ncbi:MAG: AAA family ATPase [Betaproteobacteria bacterium]|nr:AAA family ATPase [Betaproteobacteria bacterium]
MPDQAFTFGQFRLDPRGGLTRGDRQVRLTPKALALLCFLAARRGRVLTKEELFDALWPRTPVGDAALVTCIQELRKALRDNARRPRYIETLHRRGYRFIAQPEGPRSSADTSRLPSHFEPVHGLLVGREGELSQLNEALALACAGARQVVLIHGEAGIGKTALVRTFLARVMQATDIHIAWGQTAEHYGASEAYHPVLDALTRSCRGPYGERLLQALDRHAPLWLVQMPTTVAPSRLRALRRRTAGATPERMLRELTDALEGTAAVSPIVLWLEDLHWADVSTIDWLASFARRPERARVLVIGTYRPAEGSVELQPMHAIGDELRRQGQIREVALQPLSRSAVGEFIAARFAARPEAAGSLSQLAAEVHRRTEGSPLFMLGVLDELVAKGVLACQDDRWSVRESAQLRELALPRQLQQVIERQIERIAPAAARLLEIASVAGADFSAAAIAAGAGVSVAEADAACHEITRRHRFLCSSGTDEWPDGTVAGRFSFAHALYREALYERLPAARRVELHRLIGERLAQAFDERLDEIAAQLAMHFERARAAPQAILFLQKAGETAWRRSASHESAAHFERALALLETRPPGRARDELEEALRLALTVPLIAMHGLGSTNVQACATQARDLCERLGDSRGRFIAHRVVWNNSLMRHPLPATLAHARRLMDLAEPEHRPVEAALAHRALGCTLICAGEHREADRLLEHGIALADRMPDADFVRYGEHPGMICRVFGAWAKSLMGFPDQAARLADAGVAHARRRDDPHGLAFALVTVGLVHLILRDAVRADRMCREILSLSQEYKLPQWSAFGQEIRGWTTGRLGDATAGIEIMEQALAQLHATGAVTHSSRMLANLAEGYLAVGNVERARARLDAALAHRAKHGEHYYAPELYRLQALVLDKEGAAFEPIEASLIEAIEIARRQEASLLALRAAKTLAEYWSLQGKPQAARDLLAPLCARMTEGVDWPDLSEARTVLQTLGDFRVMRSAPPSDLPPPGDARTI